MQPTLRSHCSLHTLIQKSHPHLVHLHPLWNISIILLIWSFLTFFLWPTFTNIWVFCLLSSRVFYTYISFPVTWFHICSSSWVYMSAPETFMSLAWQVRLVILRDFLCLFTPKFFLSVFVLVSLWFAFAPCLLSTSLFPSHATQQDYSLVNLSFDLCCQPFVTNHSWNRMDLHVSFGKRVLRWIPFLTQTSLFTWGWAWLKRDNNSCSTELVYIFIYLCCYSVLSNSR